MTNRASYDTLAAITRETLLANAIQIVETATSDTIDDGVHKGTNDFLNAVRLYNRESLPELTDRTRARVDSLTTKINQITDSTDSSELVYISKDLHSLFGDLRRIATSLELAAELDDVSNPIETRMAAKTLRSIAKDNTPLDKYATVVNNTEEWFGGSNVTLVQAHDELRTELTTFTGTDGTLDTISGALNTPTFEE